MNKKEKTVRAYKIFEDDFTCRGMQYEVGKTYRLEDDNGKLEKPSLCKSGFHACASLVKCFEYYPPTPWSKFAIVEMSGTILGDEEDKYCSNIITIIEELSFEDLKKHYTDGVSISNGVSRSSGVSISSGVSESDGVSRSYGVLSCAGVSRSLFSHDINNEFYVFNKKISEERYCEINNNLEKLLCGWTPTFNNLRSLYIKAGSEWMKTPIPKAEEIQKEEAWKDMPKPAIEYLKSIGEFDAKAFYTITGIKTEEE